MAKSKSKFDFKQFLLGKGEYVAMGVAGFFLVVLTFWGITKWSSAKDPTAIAKNLSDSASRVTQNIQTGQPSEPDLAETKVPDWVVTPYEFKPAPVDAFKLTNPQFDPTAKPDTKKENPNVLPLGAYQVDLTRGSMKGFDITDSRDGEQMIAVIFDKKIAAQDKGKTDDLFRKIRLKGKVVPKKKEKAPNVPMGMGQPPFGGMGPMGMGQPLPFGGMGDGGMGMGMGGPFDTNAQRVEKAIDYVPISQLDEALKLQKVPAMTVIPLRMVTIHAEIPLKKQVEEIRRALRLNTPAEAAMWGPYYDGYEVRRRVTRFLPDGKPIVIQDWAEYDFEDKYRTLINARKAADNFEDGYLGYFLRYEMALALPLPQLVTEISKYPDIRLKNILETIQKLKDAAKPVVVPSDVLKRVQKGTTRGGLYQPVTADQTGGNQLWGAEAGGPMMGTGGMMPAAMPMGPEQFLRPGAGIDPNSKTNPITGIPVEVEHLLLRFVDVAVEPGYTYEYQIRLRMWNPNFKRPKEVSKPGDAEKEFLDSPWVQLADTITVPAESHLYAADWSTYSKRIKEEHEKEAELKKRLEVKDHQAVIEVCNWMEQVRTGDGGKREPVGAWVVADYPVGRGEYIGRKAYVKLPLWSSENKAYVLREIPDKVIPKGSSGKEPTQPRGWLMDFTTNKSILVDFEGGKIRTRVGNKEVAEEVGTEMLILGADGKLEVKTSVLDEANPIRKGIIADWAEWIKTVEARKLATSEDPSGLSPRPPGPGSPP